jgi:hypothetical protein
MRAWLVPSGLAVCEPSTALAEPPCDITTWSNCDLEAAVPRGCPIHLLARDGEPALHKLHVSASDVRRELRPCRVKTLDMQTARDADHRTSSSLITIAPVGAGGDAVDVAGAIARSARGGMPTATWPQAFVAPSRVLCARRFRPARRDATPPRERSSAATGCTSTRLARGSRALLALGALWLVVVPALISIVSRAITLPIV